MDVTQFNFIRISKAFATTPRFATLANIGGSGEKYREIPRCVHNRGDQALLEQGFSINAEITSLNSSIPKMYAVPIHTQAWGHDIIDFAATKATRPR